MAIQRTINVSVETYLQLCSVRDRLMGLPGEKLGGRFRVLLQRGISLASAVGLAIDLLEEEVDRLSGPPAGQAMAVIDPAPTKPKRKGKGE